MTGKEICGLMRKHKVTIRELSQRIWTHQRLIREWRKNGLTDTAETAELVEAITGKPESLAPRAKQPRSAWQSGDGVLTDDGVLEIE